MVCELEDLMDDLADDSDIPDEDDGGFGPNSYFARATQKDD